MVLSLDGRKEINDRFRKDIAGRGSYDRIVPKFQQLVKARGGKGYYMRGTFTHYNTDFTNDLFHMADDLGFDELSMEPVVSKAGSPEALTEADLPILFDQYELLAKDMLRREKAGHPITFYHYMIDLAHGPCIYKRISGCGSGTEYMAVTPWGDLYPCHQFVGDRITSWAISGTALPTPNCGMNSSCATCTPAPTARIAGHACTARAAAPPTPCTPPAISTVCMNMAAKCSASALNVP